MDITPLLIRMNNLETEALSAIQLHIKAILNMRLDTTVRAGRTATYEYKGVMHECRIVQVNRTTASCEEITPNAGRKVRVGIDMLKVDPIERKIAARPVMPTAPVKPSTTYAGASW